MGDGKAELRALVAEVGKSLGRSATDIEFLQKRLIDDEWFDSIDSLKTLSEDGWKQLSLPARFVNALKSSLLTTPAIINAPTPPPVEETPGVEVQMNDSVSFEPADTEKEQWADASLDLTLKTLIATCDPQRLPSCLLTLHKIIQALLVSPHDLSKRKIRLANPAFHRNVGSILEGVQFLQAVGFIEEKSSEDNETYLVVPTLYVSRLSDAEALLSRALQRTGAATPQTLSQRVLKPAFNPYRSNVSTSRSDADRLAGMVAEDRDPNILRKKIKQAKRIRARGGSDAPVPLNKILFPPGVTPPSFPDVSAYDADHEGGAPPMTPQQLARLSEAMSGKTQFRSTLKDELDTLNAQPIFEKTVMRICAPDRAVLQIDFRNDTKVSEVMQTLFAHALSPQFLDFLHRTPGVTTWLFESPPIKRLKDDETLYEQGMTPNGSVRLGCSAAFPGPFFR